MANRVGRPIRRKTLVEFLSEWDEENERHNQKCKEIAREIDKLIGLVTEE